MATEMKGVLGLGMFLKVKSAALSAHNRMYFKQTYQIHYKWTGMEIIGKFVNLGKYQNHQIWI